MQNLKNQISSEKRNFSFISLKINTVVSQMRLYLYPLSREKGKESDVKPTVQYST